MYRYFVLIWDVADPEATTIAGNLSKQMLAMPVKWSRAFDAPGVCAFHAGLDQGASKTVSLHQGAGGVFGRIFNRDIDDPAGAVRVQFDPSETSKIVQSGGRRLLERFWGRYVAVVRDEATNHTWIIRDPSGSMPCFMVTHQGVNLVFSDLEDCVALGIRQFTVNWGYIRILLAYSAYQSRETALNEVTEVQFGERVRLSGREVHRSLEWDPISIAQTDPIQDPETAVTELRRTVRSCVHTWASCHSDIIHNLSGGLDSSIVLSCLKDTPSRPNITCLHYFGTGPDEDERKYARLAANHLGIELIEHQLDVGEVRLEELLKLRRTSRPWLYMYELEHGPFEAQVGAARGADAFFSGAGGDGVFFQARAELAVTDFLFDHGMGRSLLRVAVDAARIARKAVWPLLLGAVRARTLPRPWHPLALSDRPERTLISRDLLTAAQRDPNLIHPWFAGHSTRNVPPGLLWHVLSVAAAPMYYSSFESWPSAERTLPLMSQPLVELCLRTPTYVLIKNGMDRATARRAFASDLPPEIIARRNKGRIDQHVRNILDANLSIVRDILLNGRLVKEGLLNRNNLERYLMRDQSPADYQYAEILQEHLCIEAWLSGWLGNPGLATDTFSARTCAAEC